MAEKQDVGHSVLPPDKKEPGKVAKASASRTNRGAVARGDKLTKECRDLADKLVAERPDMAEQVARRAFTRLVVETAERILLAAR